MDLAIEILKMRNVAQRATVIEALESLLTRCSRTIIQPVMRIWEEESAPREKPIGGD